MKVKIMFLLLTVSVNFGLFAQGSPDYGGGLKVKFDEEGKSICVSFLGHKFKPIIQTMLQMTKLQQLFN